MLDILLLLLERKIGECGPSEEISPYQSRCFFGHSVGTDAGPFWFIGCIERQPGREEVQEKMVDNAFEWAKSKNFIRKNPIHGEQEAKLVLSESFEIVDETGATTELSGSIEAEDETGALMDSDIPGLSAPDEAILAEGTATTSAENAAAASGQSSSFRIVFPAVAANGSAVTILGSFVEVLGRKIDQCEDAIDPGAIGSHEQPSPGDARLREQLKLILADMNKNYTYLTNMQAQAITSTTDETFEQNLKTTYAAITSALDEAAEADEGSDDTSDSECDDLAEELFVGFEQGVAHNAFRKHGIVDPALGKIARCARSKKNECRSLHTLIHAEGRTFPVEISEVPTPVRVLSGKSTAMTVPYPVLFLSSWCRECFKTGGSMLLGGHNLSQDNHRDMFSVLQWTLDMINLHWRILFENGIWLNLLDAKLASEEGYQQLALMTAKLQWAMLDMDHQIEAGAEYILNPLCPLADISEP
ncbi:unnamed protein product [Symbiodinium necroappetens]|uniref:Uncharacterized protein n=1 Tax=Symbiodinium necroappetens TaxID=1628268 RepID=A0A812QN18_9DINO|nr:unnamed protein product [Symbiodinium necroappetens]